MVSPRLSLSPPLLEVSFSSFFDFLTKESKPCLFSCGLRLGGWGVVRARLLERKLEGMCPRMCLGDGIACLRDNGRAARPSRSSPPPPSLPLRGDRLRPRTGGRARRALMSALGYVAAVPASPRRRGSSLGRQALPSFPANTVSTDRSTDRSCRSFRAGWGEALLSRKVTVQIGYCCWLEPGSHLLQKMI